MDESRSGQWLMRTSYCTFGFASRIYCLGKTLLVLEAERIVSGLSGNDIASDWRDIAHLQSLMYSTIP